MRKLTLFLASFVMLTGFSYAVVGADCPPGQPCIMSGGANTDNPSMEPITDSSPNYNASLEVESIRPETNITERLVNASYDTGNSSYSVRFDGVMKFNSACYRPDINIIGSGTDKYTANIHAKKLENKTCTQVITEVRYGFEFESNSPFKLEASQGNYSENFTYPDFQQDSKETGGLLSVLFNWLSGFF